MITIANVNLGGPMDWIKIKAKHISPTMPLSTIGALVKFQLLVAQLERMPTLEEIDFLITTRRRVDIEYALSRVGVDIEYVASRILLDVEHVASRRQVEKIKKRNARYLRKMSPGTNQDASCPREDKIREDKIIKEINKEKFPPEPPKGETLKRFEKPTLEAIKNYISEKLYSVDAETFFDFYESKGWLVGRVPMKNWQAAVRTWHRKNNENGGMNNGHEKRAGTAIRINHPVDRGKEHSQGLQG